MCILQFVFAKGTPWYAYVMVLAFIISMIFVAIVVIFVFRLVIKRKEKSYNILRTGKPAIAILTDYINTRTYSKSGQAVQLLPLFVDKNTPPPPVPAKRFVHETA